MSVRSTWHIYRCDAEGCGVEKRWEHGKYAEAEIPPRWWQSLGWGPPCLLGRAPRRDRFGKVRRATVPLALGGRSEGGVSASRLASHYAPPGPEWMRFGDWDCAPGFPICRSGKRPNRGRLSGATTFRVDDVTCKRCIRMLASLQARDTEVSK